MHPSENTHLTQEHASISKLNAKQKESKRKSNEQSDSTKKNYRVIYLSKPKKNKLKFHYPNNTIITSKYTWYNFFPLTLILQFKRYANIYFLITMVIQCIPIISPLNPITAVLPFVIVLAVSTHSISKCEKYHLSYRTAFLTFFIKVCFMTADNLLSI